MFTVETATIESYKAKKEFFAKPLPQVLKNNMLLMKDYFNGDYTYTYSDCRSSYKSGSEYHEKLKERFEEVIARTENQEDKDLLTSIINKYAYANRCDSIPILDHPELRNSSFYGKEKFIDAVELDQLEDTLANMRTLGEVIKSIVEDIAEKHPAYALVYTNIPHAKLRKDEWFTQYLTYNVRLVNPDITRRLKEIINNPETYTTLIAMRLWSSKVASMGGAEFREDVGVSINSKYQSANFGLVNLSYGDKHYSLLLDEEHPLLKQSSRSKL